MALARDVRASHALRTAAPAVRARAEALRLAIVHEWLVTLGGADRVLLALHEVFPQAPVYTALYDRTRMPRVFADLDVRTSWLQHLPGAVAHHRWLVPLMPSAVRGYDLGGYDVVLSSSHACAKGVALPPGAVHICYCHTPMRYAWDMRDAYLAALSRPARPLAAAGLRWLRGWDAAAARSVDHFIANSAFVASRIRRYYGRDAAVIHPPVDTAFFTPGGETAEFFLAAGRLVPYKRMDLAVEACTRLHLPLVVVGDGPELARLRAMAGPSVRFAGEVSDEELRDYYRRCRALIFPGVEDFGLVPVEAQACGRPVIAYGLGGALESVEDGLTGLFFHAQTAEALMAALREADRTAFDPRAVRRHAQQFSRLAFASKVAQFVTARAAWR
ncbi:MAG TPA: glycosyltransferase [bacterium]|nr:glycosyltransferase [bacterium]